MKKENKEKMETLLENYFNSLWYGSMTADSIEHGNKLRARIFSNMITNIIDIILEEIKEDK